MAEEVTAWGAANNFLGSAVGGSLLGLAGDLYSARQAKKAAREERAFTERMANTQYQRGVADLKAAGLNPMLAYMNSAAPTPSTSAAKVPEYGRAGDRASTGMLLQSQRQQLAAQTKATAAQGDLASASALREREAAAGLAMDNKIKEQWVPYGARSAQARITSEEYAAKTAGEAFGKAVADKKASELTVSDVMPLALALQRQLYRANELGMSQKEAVSKFWEQVGVSGVYAERAAELISDVIPSLGDLLKSKGPTGRSRSTRRDTFDKKGGHTIMREDTTEWSHK